MSPRGRIRDDDIAAVREKARIEEIVDPYTTLKRAGGDSMKGLCPFHDEKTASFHVTPSRGLWYCYGCQAGGDVIGFIQEIEGLSFPDAVRHVAQMVGVELREEVTFDPKAEKRARHYAALEAANVFFQAQLDTPDAAAARKELADRGFTGDHAGDAGCGYAPTDGGLLLAHLRDKGFSDTEVTAAGLARPGKSGVFAFFRGRLLWPIRDARGRVAGFGARRLSDSDPLPGKYVNSPDSDVFKKSFLLYGLDQARKAAHRSGRVLVVEGYTDVMACRAVGVEETVATCGTAFGVTHLGVLTRAVGEETRIVFCFDGDAAGVKAAVKAWTACRGVLNRAYGVRLPGGNDPCDLRQQDGDQALVGALGEAVPLTRLVVDDLIAATLGEHPGPEEKSRAVAAVVSLLADVPDEVVRSGYLTYAAEALGVSVDTVEGVGDGSGGGDEPPLPVQDAETPEPGSLGAGAGHLLLLERRILHRLVADPAAAAAWAHLFEPHLFTAPTAQSVCRAVLAATGEGTDVATLTPTVWAGRLLDYTNPDVGQVLTRLLSEPPPVEADVESLMTLGRARLEENLLVGRLAQARAALAGAAGGAEEDALLDAVLELDAQLRVLRDQWGHDYSGT